MPHGVCRYSGGGVKRFESGISQRPVFPVGRLAAYGDIASRLNKPNASRAVGTAIGDNPVAFLIPCHRVIRSSGELGGYRWGLTRKTAIIGWEAAQK